MTPEQQAEELKNFKQKTFITLYRTHNAMLGLYGGFYAVELINDQISVIPSSFNYKDEPCQQNIKTFETAEEAIRFYNENNR